ncbi:hypothetical protein LK540_08835 [Massilia sp. IC2-278]|uniref:hypothetical protein n=1 Tax=Massilia sp. IC2-278 TaxID=2887200 RepID=UPI001E37B5AD|nr:hypothetical protein [Massilia sp. IC2-278]MCC2960537.1 hypothetical protein [Massilia sp. IC2-278]
MNKITFIAISIVALTACSSLKQSAYQSGWNNDTNEAAYRECGMYRIAKGMPVQQNLDRLVALGKLSPEQASRASKADVRPGDPECLAFAAYGLNRKEIGITKNSDGLVISKQATYACADSDVPCPGIQVEFSDGKVTAINPKR